jgi:O-antigen/teichoic acid export membrane protein
MSANSDRSRPLLGALGFESSESFATNHTQWVVGVVPLVGAGCGFLTTMLLAKALSLESLGLYITWIFTASIFSMVAAFGLALANATLMAIKPHLLACINGDSLFITGVSGSVAALLLWVQLSRLSANVGPYALLLTVVTVPLSAATAALGGALLGRRANTAYAAVAVSQSLIQFLGAIFLASAALAPSNRLTIALEVYFAAVAIGFTLALSNSKSIALPSVLRIRANLPTIAPLWVHSILVVATQRADVLILGWFLPNAEVGRYALAIQLAYSLTYIAQGLSLALFVNFTRQDKRAAARTAGMVIRMLVVANIVLSVVVYFVVSKVLVLLIPNAARTLDLLPFLLASTTVLSSQFIFLSCCQAIGESRSVMIISCTNFILRIAGVLATVSTLGLQAVPAGLFVAALLSAGFSAAVLANKAQVSPTSLIVPTTIEVNRVGGLARFVAKRVIG